MRSKIMLAMALLPSGKKIKADVESREQMIAECKEQLGETPIRVLAVVVDNSNVPALA